MTLKFKSFKDSVAHYIERTNIGIFHLYLSIDVRPSEMKRYTHPFTYLLTEPLPCGCINDNKSYITLENPSKAFKRLSELNQMNIIKYYVNCLIDNISINERPIKMECKDCTLYDSIEEDDCQCCVCCGCTCYNPLDDDFEEDDNMHGYEDECEEDDEMDEAMREHMNEIAYDLSEEADDRND